MLETTQGIQKWRDGESKLVPNLPQTYQRRNWYPLDYRKRTIFGILGPMGCELRDELGTRYLAALSLVRQAQQRLTYAVTLTNIECANTELRRVEQYRLDVFRQIDEHCANHDCANESLEEICGQPLGSRKQAVA